jgi:hypothetical protein
MEPVHHPSEPSNHPTTPTVWSKGAKGGVITGVVLVVYSLVSNMTESPALQSAGLWVLFFSLIIGIVLTHRAFKDENAGFMSYGQGLGIGSVLGMIAGLISGIFNFIYLSFIDTGLIQRQMEQARIEMEDQGLPDEQIDQSMQFFEMIMTPGMMLIMGILGALFFAFVFSLVISAFTKNNHPEHVY